MTQVGLGAGLLMLVLFTALWLLLIRNREDGRLKAGDWMNALGFGILPGIAVWKVFEQYAGVRTMGKELFEPLTSALWITENGRFVPCRIEFIAAAAGFILIAAWLILRHERLPGNGDLLLIVLCTWGAVRSVTEGLREETVRLGPLNAVILAAVAAEIICMGIWTARRGRKEKNAGLTVPEWAAAVACGAVIILQEADIVKLASPIANLAVTVGCGILGLTLILMTGKDSREVWTTGDSDSQPLSSPYSHPAESGPRESSSPPVPLNGSLPDDLNSAPTVRLPEVQDAQRTMQYVPGSADAPREPRGTGL